ncbi:D-alanyl-D-alanine endopeptidase [Aquabacterium sp.]|uniref:D-alanyl-D-alanine endopeptidase n=1 Tax=Aquabacterium sp. TaxID=1872578 RepID=UPI0025B814EA|nr:D-alanyl-D-alanine endopeptidase [Aquabacterium sp.]
MLSVACLALSTPGLAEAKAKTKAKTRTAAAQKSTSTVQSTKVKASVVRKSRAVRARGPARISLEEPPMPLAASLSRSAGGAVIKTTAAAAAGMSAASGASFGQLYGLHHTPDPLYLKSSVAFVMDQDTNEVLLSKNSEAVLPIASLTKLMTAMVVVEAKLSLDESITITSDDVDTEKNSSSRLAVGATLTRGELLHLALMSSENRAAHALGRIYPGGMQAFVVAMNRKAQLLSMADTKYVEPTGLSSQNQSSARDLATLVKAAYQQPLIRELSTSREYAVHLGARQLQFHTTNSLVRNPNWDIGLQKTGYIVEAGRCLVLQARMAGRKLIMVFLDSTGKYSRQADAERVRRWIETAPQTPRGSADLVAIPKVTS